MNEKTLHKHIKKDREINDSSHNKIAKSKKLQSHVSLESKYLELHNKYKNAKTHKEKKKLAKQIKSMHYKVDKSRKALHKNKEHHEILHKLHGTKDSKHLNKTIHIDKSRHKIVDDTNEEEHVKLIKHVVPPVKSHALLDIGRGIKSVAVGGGQLLAVGLSNLGNRLQNVAKQRSTQQSQTQNDSSVGVEDIRG